MKFLYYGRVHLSNKRGVWFSLFVLSYFISKINTNLSYEKSVDPDQTPRLAASGLGLHALKM